jgi:phosphate transport system protein
MLHALAVVRALLARAVDAAVEGDADAAAEVMVGTAELGRRHDEAHDQLLVLIARQSPVAGDLRLALAMLNVNDRIERIASQAKGIATLASTIPAVVKVSDTQRNCLIEMARLAGDQVAEAARVLAARDVDGARELRVRDASINQHNRHCFRLAIEDGTDPERREGAFGVALMARALERVGDNAVDIGTQAVFAATGTLDNSAPRASKV